MVNSCMVKGDGLVINMTKGSVKILSPHVFLLLNFKH